jgi:hypothetical protein
VNESLHPTRLGRELNHETHRTHREANFVAVSRVIEVETAMLKGLAEGNF